MLLYVQTLKNGWVGLLAKTIMHYSAYT